MANHKFWKTQPVSRWGRFPARADMNKLRKQRLQLETNINNFLFRNFADEEAPKKDGEIVPGVLSEVPKEPLPLLDSFEWVLMDLNDEKEVNNKPFCAQSTIFF